MPTDPLDERIRALMAAAVSVAPPAPSLSLQTPVPAGPSRRGWVWAGIGIAACVAAVAALVWTSGDDDRTIVGASTTSIASVPSSSTEPSIPWPDGVAVLVASDRGLERVTGEGGQAVVTRVLDGVPVARAFETENGAIVYQETGGGMVILAADGSEQRQLPPGADSVPDAAAVADATLDDADAAGGGLRLVYRTPSSDPAASITLLASFEPNEPVSTSPPGGFGVGYGRFSIVDDHTVSAATVDDTGQRSSFTFTFSTGEQGAEGAAAASDAPPLQLAGDGAGAVYELGTDGIIRSHGTTSGIRVGIDRPEEVTALDVRSTWAAITRDGGGELVDMVSGDTVAVPVAGAGFVSVSRRQHTSTGPVPTTVAPSTSLEPSSSTVLPVSLPSMVTAGPDGVWELGSDFSVQWTDEPMAFAVKAPDGSMIMQRQSGGYPGAGWTQADTVPLRQLQPEGPIVDLFAESFAGADQVAGWWTLHDSALVDRRPLVLLDRQADQVNIESPPGTLFLYDLASGGLTEIGPVGGWESAVSRLHLAETGLIVGETYAEATRAFFAVRIDGGAAPTAADLGVEPNYYDCSDCPRLYSVSRDGATIAWLDGTTLRRHSLVDAAAYPDVDLGALLGGVVDASDLSISAAAVLLDRNSIGAPNSPVVISIADGVVVPVERDVFRSALI